MKILLDSTRLNKASNRASRPAISITQNTESNVAIFIMKIRAKIGLVILSL